MTFYFLNVPSALKAKTYQRAREFALVLSPLYYQFQNIPARNCYILFPAARRFSCWFSRGTIIWPWNTKQRLTFRVGVHRQSGKSRVCNLSRI